MSATADLRKQIETALSGRIPAALSLRPPVAPELLSCGLPEVDAVLGGGLPLAAITALTGAASSGRTTLVLSALSEVTRQGENCAYVDVSDALDPLSASALGVDLRRLLWVRTAEPHSGGTPEADVADAGSPFPSAMPTAEALGGPTDGTPAAALGGYAPTDGTPAAALGGKPGRAAGWCHPRNETVDLDRSVAGLFHVAPKRVDFTPRCSESIRRERVQPVVFNPQAFAAKPIARQALPHRRGLRKEKTSWTRLDQALRATDLLLSTGGFRVIVLDMGDVSPEQARRVPLATWYRFRLQAEKSRILFLLVTSVACANSCAAVSLHCQQGDADWQSASEGPVRPVEPEVHSPAHSWLLAGLRYRLRVERSRAVDPARKKPVASAEALWSSTALWSR